MGKKNMLFNDGSIDDMDMGLLNEDGVDMSIDLEMDSDMPDPEELY